MNSKARQRNYTIFAIGMAVLMGATAILPIFTRNSAVQQSNEPTVTPAPTVPAPPSDLSTIVFDQEYLHPSGLYTVMHPAAWVPSGPSNNGTQVQVNFNNGQQLSVIETYVDVAVPAITTLSQLSARFDDNTLASGWRSYSSWKEVGREITDSAVIIDFELQLRGQSYIARHVATLKDGWINVVRVVTPTNARDLLLDLLAKAQDVITPVELFRNTPIQWNAYYSEADNVVIRYPNSWQLQDGGQGQPASITAANQSALRIESLAGESAADEDAARALVGALRPNAQILSVEPIERNGGNGFAVAFTERNLEGESQSGLSLLLNDTAHDAVRVATLRLFNFDLDLNEASDVFVVKDAQTAMTTFNLAEGLGLPVTAVVEEPAATE